MMWRPSSSCAAAAAAMISKQLMSISTPLSVSKSKTCCYWRGGTARIQVQGRPQQRRPPLPRGFLLRPSSSRNHLHQRRTTTTNNNVNKNASSVENAGTEAALLKDAAATTTTANGGGKRQRALIEDILDTATLQQQHDVRLTQTELSSLRSLLDINKDGRVSISELQKAGKNALERRWIRELYLTAVEKPSTKYEHMSSRLLSVLDYSGTALFAVVGCQLAGNSGMNLIGCVLVGSIAAMGGGTLNNVLYGSSSLLLEPKPGVFWVRVPMYLSVALMASVLTFYGWPIICRQMAKNELEECIGKENLDKDGSVGRHAFINACKRDSEFAKSVAIAFGIDPNKATPHELFVAATAQNNTQSAKIRLTEMEALVAKQVDSSSTMYILDSLALAAFAVVAVNGAVQRGLHPVVAATSGVTICFGGILRDVLCGRDLAIGGQSYAFATGVGSTVYVLLRELRLQGMPFPLLFRIICAFGTTIGLRAWEFVRGEPILHSMHYHHDKDSSLLHSLNHHTTQEWLESIGKKAE